MEKKANQAGLDSRFLEQAVFAIADGYCRIDLTRDLVPGVMHYVADGQNYDLNAQIGLPENAGFTELVRRWCDTVPESGRQAFLAFFDRETLLRRFAAGERHLTFQYWTRTADYRPILAENHLAMFADEATGDVLAVNYMVDRTEQYQMRQYKEELEQKNRELEKLLEAEKNYNTKLYHDALTGAFNRRYYEEIVRGFVGPAGVALMDLDDFKVYNDTYGHYAGDLALEVAAGAIRSCIHPSDLLIRYGGDEFLLVLVGIPEKYLRTKLEQIRDKVHDSSVPGFAHLHLSLSIGGAMQTRKDAMETIVRRADRLMYQAKTLKDEVVVDAGGLQAFSGSSEKKEGKPQILIVDDSRMNRALLAEILQEDYRILEAENGRECMAALYENQGSIALVLLDINMPEMDGFEVLENMNNDHTIEDVPVIMISSDDSEAAIRRAYELGASDYVRRPFDARIVYRRVANTVKLYTKQRRLVRMVSTQIRKQEHNTSMLVGVLSQIVEFRNGESGSHVRHIRVITEMLLSHLMRISGKYRISTEEQEDIPLASALHDIGKIAIDETILNKPGRLTPEEFEIIKTHSMRGAEMLSKLENFEEEPLLHTAYEIARWHHERWDGRGYPDGLKGDEIPISAQIVSMADVYDALTSERCYKKAFSHEAAIRMIREGECGAFNPLLLRCLLEIEGRLKAELQTDYVVEASPREVLEGRQTAKAGWQDAMIVQALLPEFDYVCRIDAATGRYLFYYADSRSTALPQKELERYEQAMAEYNRQHIVPEQEAALTERMRISNLVQELAKADEYVLYAEMYLGPEQHTYKRLRFRYEDETRQNILLTQTDVSGMFREREKREAAERHHTEMLTKMPIAICSTEVLLDEEGRPYDFRYTYCNPAHEQLEGVQPGGLIGKGFYQYFKNADPKWLHYYYETAWLGRPQVIREYSPEIGKDLVIHTFRTEPGHCDCVVRDVTQENFLIRELHQSREEIKRVLEATMIAVFQYDPVTDLVQRSIYSRTKDSRVFHAEELLRTFSEFERLDEESILTLRDCFSRMKRGEHSLSAPLRCKRRDSTQWMWCKVAMFDYQDEETKARRVLGYLQDINSDMTRQTKLLAQAQMDALTGLLNVGAGRSRVRRQLRAPAEGCRAMIMMDVDDFKVVNDTHGHLVGDHTLKALADALSRTFVGNAIVYRLGGDEFAVFLPHLKDPEAEVRALMENLSDQLRQAKAEHPFLSVSAGIYITNKAQDYESCYDAADRALYATKKRQKGTYTLTVDCE